MAERFFYARAGKPETVRTYYYYQFQTLKLKRLRLGKSGTNARPRTRHTDKLYTWVCQWCGQPFETKVFSQRYCNPTHKQYAYRERHKSVDGLSVNKKSP